MRRLPFVAALMFASLVSVIAQQAPPPGQQPPTPPPPAQQPTPAPPALAKPAAAPPSIPARETLPPVVPAPQVPPVPSVAPPVAGFLPTQKPAPAPTPRPGAGQTPRPAPGVPPAANIPLGTTWQNVKLEVKISDSLNLDAQSSKSVSMLILDGRSGQVRSTSGEGLINIDARPSVRADGRIFLQLTVEYRPELTTQQANQSGTSRVAMFTESLSLIVLDGKPIIASQSADPRSDRKVSVEVTATVLK